MLSPLLLSGNADGVPFSQLGDNLEQLGNAKGLIEQRSGAQVSG
jgi:hypothetical protein